MGRFSRWAESVFHILCGARIALPPALLLLCTYGWCLMNPAQPNYFQAKLRRMFDFSGPSVLTWRAVAVGLFGIGMAVIGALQPFLRRSPDGGFADAWREKAEEASGKFWDRGRPAPSKESITLSDPTYSGTSTDIFSDDER
jgi:hypothetical protein